MSDIDFKTILKQVRTLSYEQLVILKNQVDCQIEKELLTQKENKSRFSEEEARLLFEKFSGSISREIDCKKEHAEWIDERYNNESINKNR